MAHDILAALRDNLLLRASVATAAGIVLLGVASGALPLTCFTGLAACRATPELTDSATSVVTQPTSAAADLKRAVETKVASVSGPTLTHNDVVGGTFAMLDVELSPPPDDTELRTRKVTTLAIGSDGQPLLPGTESAQTPLRVPAPLKQLTVAPLVAEAAAKAAGGPIGQQGLGEAAASSQEPAPQVAASDVPLPKVRPHEEAVASELAVAPPDKTDPPKSKGGAVVKGLGANVHSSASKKSKVLFAIGPGTKLTVSDSDHGWLKISDGKGHTGWVWEELVIRN